MTEILADYRVAGEIKQGVTWKRCPKCNMVFGYEIEGGRYLRVGKVKVKFIKAECGDCGRLFWWGSMDRHLKKITKNRSPSV
jgi:uncharacterized protein with PIN domain